MNLEAQNTQTEYRETPIGKIPREWEVAQLGRYVDILTGDSFSSKRFGKEGVPLIRIRDIDKDRTEANYNGSYDSKYLIEPESILIGMDGEFNVHIWGGPKGLLNQRVCKIWSSAPNVLDNKFLYYAIKKPIKVIEAQVGQTTVKHLSKKDIQKIRIPLPPLPEQKKIAEILSTVDEAIQKVDGAIEKTERLKKGLMQELLTKGIDHEEFRETPIGKIPREWGVIELSDLGQMQDGDWILKKYYEESGIRLLQIGDIGVGQFLDSSNRFISPESAKELGCTFVEPRKDILISRMPDPIGRACVAPSLPYKYIVAVDVSILRVKNQVDRKFILYAINFPQTLFRIEKLASGATRKRVSRTNLEKIKIPLPPLPEQKKIAEILSIVDEKLELERKRKERFERIKKGLMQDLLTGKVRVKI